MDNFILCQDLNNTSNQNKVTNFLFSETTNTISKVYKANQYVLYTNTTLFNSDDTRDEIVAFIMSYITSGRDITTELNTLCYKLGIVIKSRNTTSISLSIIYNLTEYSVYFDDGTLPIKDCVVFESSNDELGLDIIGKSNLNQLSIPLRETDYYIYQDNDKTKYFLIFYLTGLTITDAIKIQAVKDYLIEHYPDTYRKDYPYLFISDADYISHSIYLIQPNESIEYSASDYLSDLASRDLNPSYVTLKWNYLSKHNMIIDTSLNGLIDNLSSENLETLFGLIKTIEQYLLYNVTISDANIALYTIRFINSGNIRFTFPTFGNIIVSL